MSKQQATDLAESPQPPPAVEHKPWRHAGTSPRAVAVFIAVMAVMLAGDLALKYVSFAHVADRPVENVAEAAEDADAFWQRYPHQPVDLIPGVLSLRLTTNTGAVFGWAAGSQWLFIIVSIVACGVIVYLFVRSRAEAWLMHVALALILAGALCNLYDRLRYAAVRDMLWLFPETGLWPYIFNLADAALMVGVITVIALTWWHELRQRGAESTAG